MGVQVYILGSEAFFHSLLAIQFAMLPRTVRLDVQPTTNALVNRIDSLFRSLSAKRRKALSAFITAGDPARWVTPLAMHALVEGGADIIELGIPFSDPESDGPAIQAASQRALSGADPTALSDVLEVVVEFRARDEHTPVLLMGYLNSLLAMGIEPFTQRAAQSGVDGVILVNLPLEEFDEVKPAFETVNLHIAFLVAPTTSQARAALIASEAKGFLYYVSLKGVTGALHLNMTDLALQMKALRKLTDLPIQIGFGIRNPEAAEKAAPLADGLIVGTAFVNRMAELQDRPKEIPPALRQLASEFKAAIDRACES